MCKEMLGQTKLKNVSGPVAWSFLPTSKTFLINDKIILCIDSFTYVKLSKFYNG